jgi:hypothetical protein
VKSRCVSARLALSVRSRFSLIIVIFIAFQRL